MEEIIASLMERTTISDRKREIREAVRNLPKYDGETKSLSKFLISVVDERDQLEPDDEAAYLKGVRSRLTGAARDSLEGKTITTVDALIKHLKNKFAPGRSVISYITQINLLNIKSDESVKEYIARTAKLVKKAKAAARGDRTRAEAAESLKDIEVLALDSFLRGLPEKIYLTICHRDPASLDDAFDLALREDRARRNRRHAIALKDQPSSRSRNRGKKKTKNHQKSHQRKRSPSSSDSSSDSSDSSSSSSSGSSEEDRKGGRVYTVESGHSNREPRKNDRWRWRQPQYRDEQNTRNREEPRESFSAKHCCCCTKKPYESRARSPSPYNSSRASSTASTNSLNCEGARQLHHPASAKLDKTEGAAKEARATATTRERETRRVKFEKTSNASSKRFHQPESKSTHRSSDKAAQSSS